MKKIRKLSFLGVLGVVIAVLFLISISFTQAQVKIQKKPVQPPEATWAVRIPTLDSGYMFYGMDETGGYYENNDADIKVSVEKHSPGAWKRHYNFVYSFDFTLTNENVGTGVPPAYQVGFQDVDGLDAVEYPDDKPYCQFPDIIPGDNCMANFLNNVHPYSGGESGEEDYQYLLCRVSVFDQDIELMDIGDKYLFGSASDPDEPGDFFRIKARYRQECYPQPAYHDVELYRSINFHRAIDLGNPLNIEIVRLDATDYETEFGIGCEAVWRICVLPVDYRFIDGFLKVQEQYCIRSKWYHPMEAKGNFNFYIDFIKNPQSSTPPDAPTNLNAAAPACDQINLSWNDNSDNEDGFDIDRDGVIFTTVSANVTSYIDTGLLENTAYSYRVRAYNDTGESAYSTTASATTPSCNGTELPPDAPTGLTANARGKSKIALNWTDNSTNEDEFYIYRDSGSGLILYDAVGQNTTSYVDNQVSSKTTYYYQVCAYNDYGENCSNTDSATTK